MYIIGYLLRAIGNILNIIINLYIIMIIVHSILTWINVNRTHRAITILNSFVEPYLKEIRRIFPFNMRSFGVDISPLVGILILYFIDSFLVQVIIRTGQAML